MSSRSWKNLVASGVALATGVAMAALATPAHAAGVAGITSAARAQDEVMNYAVNLPASASYYDYNAAVSKASETGVVLAQYPQFNSFFVQSVKADFAPELGQSLVSAGLSYDSIGPTRYKTVSGDEVRVRDLTAKADTAEEAAAVNEAASTRTVGLSADSQLADYVPDPGDADAWGLTAIGAIEAAQVDVPRESVVVGVMDTGLDKDHPDFAGQVDESRSVSCKVNGLPDQNYDAWKDDHYHGTHVAGTIAAAHNALGVDGVAPNAKIAAIKVSNQAGSFYPEYVACGFVWAADHDIDVTNSSYYMDPYAFWLPNDPTQAAGMEAASRAVRYSKERGVVNFAAEGNSDDDHDNPTIDTESPNDVEGAAHERNVAGGVDVPSMLNDSVVSVSSVALPSGANPATDQLVRSNFSNYGANSVDVAAPGSRIWSTVPTWIRTPEWAYLSGTSMASPHAAAVAALIKEIHPDYTPDQTIALLKKQAGYTFDRLAAPTDGKEYRGAGLVNALAAVTKDQPTPTVAAVEYSRDGSTWTSLDGATLSGMAYVRATITGPVTSATMDVAGLDTVNGTADGSFSGSLTLTSQLLDLSTLGTGAQNVAISANGRNNDERADDDITSTTSFTASVSGKEGGHWVPEAAGWMYKYDDGSYLTSTTEVINGAKYSFDAAGYMRTGWVKDGDAWAFYGASGGAQVGWVKDGSSWYYIDPASGTMSTGWVKDGSFWYYLNSSGAMATGWLQLGSTWYYLNGSGQMVTGWAQIGSSWYYFTPSGAMATGWVSDGGTWYYMNASGQMVTGWAQIGTTRYHFAPSGAWDR